LPAHWRYKEGRRDDRGAIRPAASPGCVACSTGAWTPKPRRKASPSLGQAASDAGALAKASASERVYAMTPQGRVVELPVGATPVDFAYHVHTELGHRCRGARVDGSLVALNTRLRTGQTVEVITARSGGPSRDWLNPELGYLASARSRTKVRQWFNAIEHEQSVAAGREAVTRELQRLGRTAVSLEDLARQLSFASVDELCLALAREELSLRSIEQAVSGVPREAHEADLAPALRPPKPTTDACWSSASTL